MTDELARVKRIGRPMSGLEMQRAALLVERGHLLAQNAALIAERDGLRAMLASETAQIGEIARLHAQNAELLAALRGSIEILRATRNVLNTHGAPRSGEILADHVADLDTLCAKDKGAS